MTPTPAPILLFPTHYLGNFVLGLPWVLRVLESHPDAMVVLDSRFAGLARLVLPDSAPLLYYPRDKLAKNQPVWRRLRHYLVFLRRLRSRPRATLVDLEGERFTGVLAWLSGCDRRIGPQGKHAERFYTEALDLNYERHRFNAFGAVCADFVDDSSPQALLPFRVDEDAKRSLDAILADRQAASATDGYEAKETSRTPDSRPWVAIHAGASVPYKLWPRDYFRELAGQLEARGYRIAWVGAGEMDAEIIRGIREEGAGAGGVDLCNRLSLPELLALYRRCALFIGSDSGPMHLAASSGAQVLALFGPSREAIWAPLGPRSRVLRGERSCAADCDAFHCRFDYHCLTSLQPAQVMAAVQRIEDSEEGPAGDGAGSRA